MKKLILIFFLFVFTSFNYIYYSTTWAGNASNQELTKTAWQDGFTTTFMHYYASGNSFGTGNECITKTEVGAGTTWSGLNPSYTPYANKSSGSLITKSDMSLTIVLSTTSGSSGCSQSGSQFIYTDAEFTRFYTDTAMTVPFAGSGNYYSVIFQGFDVQINSSGYRTNISYC